MSVHGRRASLAERTVLICERRATTGGLLHAAERAAAANAAAGAVARQEGRRRIVRDHRLGRTVQRRLGVLGVPGLPWRCRRRAVREGVAAANATKLAAGQRGRCAVGRGAGRRWRRQIACTAQPRRWGRRRARGRSPARRWWIGQAAARRRWIVLCVRVGRWRRRRRRARDGRRRRWHRGRRWHGGRWRHRRHRGRWRHGGRQRDCGRRRRRHRRAERLHTFAHEGAQLRRRRRESAQGRQRR